MSKNLVLAMMLAGSALMAGCASVPMSSPEEETQAKTFAVKPGVANIYLYRNQRLGATATMEVLLDGKPAGKTASATFMRFEVRPGKHVLVSRTESESTLDLDVVAGKNYFVWQEVKIGVFAPSGRLRLVDEAVGKAGVDECNLIAPLK